MVHIKKNLKKKSLSLHFCSCTEGIFNFECHVERLRIMNIKTAIVILFLIEFLLENFKNISQNNTARISHALFPGAPVEELAGAPSAPRSPRVPPRPPGCLVIGLGTLSCQWKVVG